MKKSTGIILILAALSFSLVEFKCQNKEIQQNEEIPFEPKYEYGILVDSFSVKKGVVKKGAHVINLAAMPVKDMGQVNTLRISKL